MNADRSRMDRRAACAALAGAGLALLLPQRRARAEDWSCRLIALEPEPDALRPPVVSAVALSPQGKLLAIAGDDHRIRILDLATGKTLKRRAAHGDWVRALAYSPDGKIIASAGNDGRIVLWNSDTATEYAELAQLSHPVTAIAFNPSGGSLASTGFEDDVRVFDVAPRKESLRLRCPCSDMRALAYSPDLRLLAGGGRNGVVRVWDVSTGKVVQEFQSHHRRVWGVVFAPDSQAMASCGEDGKIKVVSLTGAPDITLDNPGTKVMSLCFCGPTHLAAGGSDNLIRIWDVAKQAKITELSGHTGSIVTLAFGGNVLISAGYDTTVRVWTSTVDLATGPGEQPARVGSRWEPRNSIQQ
jgi:WD40 repeat protein